VAANAPVNGIVEIAGPEPFRFAELIQTWLSARHDPRDVVVDSTARYYGALMSDGELLPGADARIAETRFADWLKLSAT
jgi:hypothetical protein